MQFKGELVLMRHAQSEFNAQGRFTGWTDCDLSPKGKLEAQRAGELLRTEYGTFSLVLTSRLKRAANTALIVMSELGENPEQLIRDWRFNERHFGELQGRSRAELKLEVGEEQVWRWRRGYSEKPPEMRANDPRHPSFDPLYADVEPGRLPGSESLIEARSRLVEAYLKRILPRLQKGERVLLVAHGFCLRALLMELCQLSVAEVESFELPTATPIVCYWAESETRMNWKVLIRP